MKNILMRCALAIVALMPAVLPAAAWTCDEFATLATKAVNAIRDMGGCGFDLSNSLYSTNKGTHNRWCRALVNSDPDAVETRLRDLTAQAEKCSYCNKYARLMSDAARDNISYGCGFDPTNNYWNPDRNFHFKGCMAHSHYEGCIRVWGVVCAGSSTLGEDEYYARTDLDPNVGHVLQEIAECKLRHPVPKGCMSGCHGGSQSVGLPAALRPIKRGSGEHNFSIGRVPPSFKRDGTSSGDSDKAQPSGARQRTPSGSSNSAMDRLGGGGGGGGSTSSSDRQSGATQRPSSGGGASSPSGGGSAPNIGINTITNPGRMYPGQSPGLR